MKLLMENWRQFVDETHSDKTDVIFLFENNQITTLNFNLLLERYEDRKITLNEFCQAWQRSVLYEAQSIEKLQEELLSENILNKIKDLAGNAKKAFLDKVSAAFQKAKAFAIKTGSQAVQFFAKISSAVKKSYDKVGRKIYIGAIKTLQKLLTGAFKVMKFVGPYLPVILMIIIGLVGLEGTAHAASLGTVDSSMLEAAMEVLNQAFQALGGVEALEPETVESLQAMAGDAQGIETVSLASAPQSMTEVNQVVDAMKAIDSAFTIQGQDPNEWLQKYVNESPGYVKKLVQGAIDTAENVKETDPELYKQYVEEGKKIELTWYGHIEGVSESFQAAGKSGTGQMAVSKVTQTGFDFPVK